MTEFKRMERSLTMGTLKSLCVLGWLITMKALMLKVEYIMSYGVENVQTYLESYLAGRVSVFRFGHRFQPCRFGHRDHRSIRVREGDPTPRSLESLVDWFTERLCRAEKSGSEAAAPFDQPPAPWSVVGAAGLVRRTEARS